jgi:hypothetical protein
MPNSTKGDYMTKFKMPELGYTSNYTYFRRYPFNREINDNAVKMLVDDFKEKGQIHPISVIEKKANDGTPLYFIFDGQHREKACEILRIPVKYLKHDIDPSDIPGTMAKVNNTSKPWGHQVYLDLWVAHERPDHLRLNKFRKETGLEIKHLFLLGKIEKGRLDFKDGKDFLTNDHISNLEQNTRRLKDIQVFLKSSPEIANSKQFISAVARIVANTEYSHENMINKMTSLSGKIRKSAAIADYFSVLLDIYNYKLRDKLEFKRYR